MESFDNRFTSQVDFNNSDVCIEFCRQMIKVIIIHCLCGGGMIIFVVQSPTKQKITIVQSLTKQKITIVQQYSV
jgi:hypothetical protein